MIDAHLTGKEIQTSDIARFIIGGQTGVDGIRSCLAPVIGGEDMTSLSWSWFLVFKNINGAEESVELTPIFENDLVKLPWIPGVTATQVPGKLEIQIYATQSSGEEIVKKWVSERKIIYVQEAVDSTPIIPTTPTLLEQFLTTFTSLKDEAEASALVAQEAQIAAEIAKDTVISTLLNLETRVDTILVAQELDPNKDLEILDARISPITGSHDTLGSRMTESEKIMRFQSQADYVQSLQSIKKPNKREWVKSKTEVAVVNSFGDYTIGECFNLSEADGFIKWNRTVLDGGSLGLVIQAGSIANRTGSWITSYMPNCYTTEVGATFTNTLNGNYFKFVHLADNRGGLWKFEIDCVEFAQRSVWSETLMNPVTFIFGSDSLDPDISYTIVATFQGDDPENVPSGGAGTARGWVSDDSDKFRALSAIIRSSDSKDFLTNHSNRDFAFQFKYGSVNAFVPYHGSITLSHIDTPSFIIDGIEYTATTLPEFVRAEFSMIVIEQHFYGVIDSTNVAEFWHKTTINSGVVSFAIKMKILELCQIYNGYSPMLPARNNSLETLISSIGNRVDNAKDESITYLSEEIDYGSSYIAIDSTNKNLASAVSIDYPMKTNRIEIEKVGPWILNNAASYMKFYNQIFRENDLSPGFEWSEYFRFASIIGDNLYEIFS